MAETIVADGGKLANVFVYVKEGVGDRTFDVPKDSVTIDQKGCQYHPHVLGVMTGQNIEIRNDDDTTHNIHPTPKDNREWNESQPPQGCGARKKLRPRRNHAAGKVQPASLDEDVLNVVKTPVLCGHRRGRQVRNQGPAAGRLHAGICAGKAGRTDTEGHAGRQRQQDRRPGFQTVIAYVAPASLRASRPPPAGKMPPRQPPGRRRYATSKELISEVHCHTLQSRASPVCCLCRVRDFPTDHRRSAGHQQRRRPVRPRLADFVWIAVQDSAPGRRREI